jgi:hypothetical protein
VLSAFGVLVSGVDAREDQGGWMRGRGFVGFCECWMGFAKRVSSNPFSYSPYRSSGINN